MRFCNPSDDDDNLFTAAAMKKLNSHKITHTCTAPYVRGGTTQSSVMPLQNMYEIYDHIIGLKIYVKARPGHEPPRHKQSF